MDQTLQVIVGAALSVPAYLALEFWFFRPLDHLLRRDQE